MNRRLWFSYWCSPSGFVFFILPHLQITRLPPEEAKSYVDGDYAFSVTAGWLFFTITYCFGEYRRLR